MTNELQAVVDRVCLFTRPFTQNTITQSNNVGAVNGTKALLQSQA